MTSCLDQVKSYHSTTEMSTALIHKLTSHVHNVKSQVDKVTSHVPSKDEVRKNLKEVKSQVHSIRKIQKLRAPLKSYLVGVGPIKIERAFYLLQECEFYEREYPKSYNHVDKSFSELPIRTFSELPIRLQQRFLINLRSKIEKITSEDIDKAIEKKNQDLIKKYIRIMQIRNRTKT